MRLARLLSPGFPVFCVLLTALACQAQNSEDNSVSASGSKSGIAAIEAFIAEQKVDKSNASWKSKLAKPPKVDFEPGEMRYADTSFRFLHGSPCIPAWYAALPGYRTVQELGVANIRRKSVRQTQLLFEAAAERGFKVTSPPDPEHRGGFRALGSTALRA